MTAQTAVEDDMADKPYYGTKIRSVRVADDLWADAQRVAKDRDESVTEVIVQALQRYVKRNDKGTPQA
jgi:predicted transcriptional regulator